MKILGISAFYHDSAACLVRDGEIVAAAQEERFTRKKHDHRFPSQAVLYCLQEGGIGAEDLDIVAFYDKPWIKFERLIETYLTFAPAGISSFLTSMPLWLKEKLWMEQLIRKEIGYEGELVYPEHHLSHAASAFYPSPFERAAILTIDGVGEWATASWGTGAGNRIEMQAELRFPHSLGLLYSAFTYYTGFKVNSGEYKVMGLAAYGEPRYVDLILDHLMDLKQDGSFRLDMKYFNYCQGLTMTSAAFHDLFGGPPRRPETELTQREMDLARSVQDVAEMVMLRMARFVKQQTDESTLCMAGGVALNCVSNGKILREQIYDDIWIQPAAGDSGGALGAALYAWHQLNDGRRDLPVDGRDLQRGSYLGPRFSPDEIESWLRDERLPYHKYEPNQIPDLVADFICDGKVVGWFSGRMEFGPRALGARSIIGDARDPKMQTLMNLKIKFRESFRPFAPSCLVEDAAALFELDRPSPYMLLVAPVRPELRLEPTEEQQELSGLARLSVPRSKIPAVTHVDYSARVHTVDAHDHPQYYRLLQALKQRTGYGLVVNTSMNIRGEPIVGTPPDAYGCFMRTQMDLLVMENLVLYKEETQGLRKDADECDLYEPD